MKPPNHPKDRSRGRAIGLAAVLAAATAVAAGLAMPAQAASTLKASAEAKGRYFGTALTRGDLGISAEANLAAAQFDMVTPGNEMKWDATEPSRGSFNFGSGDQIVSFAQSHGMRVRGHNLVWHAQLPAWVSSLPLNQVQGVMENHITTEATHYKGKVYAWDVVNEPYNEDGTLRQDVFYKAMGANYIANALRAAHAADPNAKLYINDYNIEGTNAKSNALYSLAQSLVSQGVPLHGIGFESHFVVGQIPSSLQANMQRFANLGLDVAITELDDRIPMPADSSELQQQGSDYGKVVNACLAVSRCVGVSQWGVDDGHSWIPGTFPGYGAPMMWDSGYQPKPAYTAALNALNSAPGTSPSPTPPVSPSPTPPASPSPTPPVTGACSATMTTTNSWPGGFQSEVTVRAGGSAVNGWTVKWTWPGGQTISSLWNGTQSGSGSSVTVRNASYNGSLGAGASTTFGFTANGGAATPSVTCTSP
ncbi:endo-1,4-beta-xylanase [Microbispora sp. KK1-11]|uniref:endo-1,4-beta-xylanase n=1 Tax=Microbispora sp. KK1-11 TaxID=2053005 RepID=UPI001156ECFA|nr:endo-1,4-beta-xylanase [Microbispora sp. KK1-11]TQS19460.1 glycoside hydrolase [Microbispora sp. KK1-11]